jgi:TonB family protein
MTDRETAGLDFLEGKVAKRVWVGAAALALGAHLAFAAFAIAAMREDPDEDDLGAPGIEVSLELASPLIPPQDLPPGPESEASAMSPPVAEQKVETKDVDLPKEKSVESENPDRLVTMQTTKEPNEKDPEIQTQPTKRSNASVAQDAMAMPSVPNAQEATHSTTRDQGTGRSQERMRVTWQKELLAHLNKYKRYPSDRSERSAEILVTFAIDRTGHVLQTNVAKGSGDVAFDHAALAMVERASPLPAPPPLVADEGLVFSLPVIFKKAGGG